MTSDGSFFHQTEQKLTLVLVEQLDVQQLDTVHQGPHQVGGRLSRPKNEHSMRSQSLQRFGHLQLQIAIGFQRMVWQRTAGHDQIVTGIQFVQVGEVLQ